MFQDASQQDTTSAKDSNASKSRAKWLIEGLLSSTVLANLLVPGGIGQNLVTTVTNGLPWQTAFNPAALSQLRQGKDAFGENAKTAEDCIQPDKFANFNASEKKLTVSSAVCSSSNRVALYIKGPNFPNGTYQFVPIKPTQSNAFVDFWVQKAVAEASPSRLPLAETNKAQTLYASTIICQKQLDGGLLRRRIKDDDGSCTDETIDLTTGNVTKREKANSCSGDCS